jgi:hypothetical protein
VLSHLGSRIRVGIQTATHPHPVNTQAIPFYSQSNITKQYEHASVSARGRCPPEIPP